MSEMTASRPQNANRFIIKITGTAEIDRLLEFGKEYTIQVKTEVRSINKIPCDDGTFDYQISLRQSHVELIVDGEKVIAKDKSSKSKKLRGALWHEWNREGAHGDSEDFYQVFMTKLMLNLPEVIEYLKHK